MQNLKDQIETLRLMIDDLVRGNEVRPVDGKILQSQIDKIKDAAMRVDCAENDW